MRVCPGWSLKIQSTRSNAGSLPRRTLGDSILQRPALACCALLLQVCTGRIERPIAVRVSPKRERDGHRIDIDPGPPCGLVAVLVKLAMMQAADWDCEFVADLAAQSSRLRKANVMRV